MVEGLKILANAHRANIMRVLHQKSRRKFAEIMQETGLDPKKDCGTFGYHLSALTKAGVILQDSRGLYSLTERGEAVWSLMQQIHLEGEEVVSREESALSITRFGAEDIGDYAKFIHERIDRDASTKFVETITRHTNFVDGRFGSFDDKEMRVHSYIARSLLGGDVVGAIFGFTYFNAYPSYPLYGEKRLTLKIRGYNLDPDVDRKDLLSRLLGTIIKVADDYGYHIEMDAWNPEDYEMEVFRELGLHAHELPRILKVSRLALDWEKEHTLRQLKAEGFDEELINLIGTEEIFTTKQAAEASGLGQGEAGEQVAKLANRRVITKKDQAWVLSQRYRTPRPRNVGKESGKRGKGDGGP